MSEYLQRCGSHYLSYFSLQTTPLVLLKLVTLAIPFLTLPWGQRKRRREEEEQKEEGKEGEEEGGAGG